MNDFSADLAWSHSCDEQECWVEIYHKAFPGLLGIFNHRQDGDHQRVGVDRSITLSNSKQVLVDEKARRIADTGDIMLEYVSNDTRGTLGWAEKSLLADYIAYAFIPSGTAYLLPVIQLQAAWMDRKEDWIKRFGTRRAQNATYQTLNCPVPIPTLYPAIGEMLRVRFTPPSPVREELPF